MNTCQEEETFNESISATPRQIPGRTRPNFNASILPHDVVHHIRTTGPPVFSRPRRLAPARLAAAKAEFDHMLQMGTICQSAGPWTLPVHMVPKAATGDWRLRGDHRALNNITVPDCYPGPHLQDFSGTLFGNSVFSKIDLVRAFHQIPIAAEDVSKTAVTTPFGLFEFLRMPFGLRNASQIFQRFVDRVLCGLPFVYAYINDLLVVISTDEEHMEHLETMFDWLRQFGVVLNPSKRVFDVPSLTFLGHLVDSHGIHPPLSKVAQGFPGMVSYYRRHLPRCADTILLLTSLLSGPKVSFELSTDALTVFDKADAILVTQFSPDAPISLVVDASNVAVSTVLQQHLAGRTQPLAFFLMKLSLAETRYSTFGRELLAVFLAVKHFRHFLEERDFTVFTDHKPLSFVLKYMSDKLNPWEIRQLDYISQFTSDIRHINGSRHEVTDALFRHSIAHLQHSPGIDLTEMVAKQRRFGSPGGKDVSGLRLQDLPLTIGDGTILCDVSTTSHRPLCHHPSAANSSPPCATILTLGVELPTSWIPTALSGLGLYSHPQHTLSSGSQRDGRAVSPPAARLSTRRRRSGELDRPHPQVLLGIRSSLKSDHDCSTAELVFGATIRLSDQMISPTPRVTVEDPTSLLYRLRQFMRTHSAVPPRPSVSKSYLEKDLETCSHDNLRCDRVRRPLEPTYDDPFRVISRGTKNFHSQRENREEDVGVDRLKTAVPDTPPDEPCGPLLTGPPLRPSAPSSCILNLPPRP
ncbi:hypothetical protein SprV_0602071900 [Sparganum proliferum]